MAKKRVIDCTIGKSLASIPSRIKFPSPGIEKTLSITTEPPSAKAVVIPITVITGMNAFFSACRAVTVY